MSDTVGGAQMRPEILLTISHVSIFIGGVIALAGGYGAHHFSKVLSDSVEKKSLDMLTELVAGQSGDIEKTKEIIKLKSEKAFDTENEEQAKEFIEGLVNDLPDRIEQAQAIEAFTPEVTAQLNQTWADIVAPMFAAYESRVTELKKHIEVVSEVPLEYDILITDDRSMRDQFYAEIVLPNNVNLSIRHTVGLVLSGKLERSPRLDLYINRGNNSIHGSQAIFKVNIINSEVRMTYGVNLETGNDKNLRTNIPASEDQQKQLLDGFLESLNDQFTLGVVEAQK